LLRDELRVSPPSPTRKTASTMNTITPQAPSFAAYFHGSIPSELRSSASAMSRHEFLDNYCPADGPIRLAAWSEQRGSYGTRQFEGTIGLAGQLRCFHVDAVGPIAALSCALHEAGFGIEILSFHQQRTVDGTATFVNCEHDGRRHWAMALSDDDTDSALQALIAAANLLS
jgi:hypothetical protein